MEDTEKKIVRLILPATHSGGGVGVFAGEEELGSSSREGAAIKNDYRLSCWLVLEPTVIKTNNLEKDLDVRYYATRMRKSNPPGSGGRGAGFERRGKERRRVK